MSDITIGRIKDLAFFAGCRRSDFERADRLGATVAVPAGRQLCVEGGAGREFFVLVEGLVDARDRTGELALMHAGGWFGETALVCNALRRATVATVVDSLLLVFGRREFNSLRPLSSPIRERINDSAAMFAAGSAPTNEPWYQPVARVAPRRTDALERNAERLLRS